MSVETERVEHFNAWRNARRVGDYDTCEHCIRDLLSTLSINPNLRIKLSNIYNKELMKLVIELSVLKEAYTKDKRLSKGFAVRAMQDDRQKQFWDETYDIFYYEFVSNSLFPSYIAENG